MPCGQTRQACLLCGTAKPSRFAAAKIHSWRLARRTSGIFCSRPQQRNDRSSGVWGHGNPRNERLRQFFCRAEWN